MVVKLQSLKEYDEMRKRGDDSKLNNPPGLLISGTKGACGVSCDFSSPKAESTVPELATSEGAESQSELGSIRDYLAKLSPQERESLELVALGKRPALLSFSPANLKRSLPEVPTATGLNCCWSPGPGAVCSCQTGWDLRRPLLLSSLNGGSVSSSDNFEGKIMATKESGRHTAGAAERSADLSV